MASGTIGSPPTSSQVLLADWYGFPVSHGACPFRGGADVSFAMAGLIAASAVSIALHQRDHAGQGAGCHIDVSLQEAAAAAAMQTATPSNWTWFDRIPRRPGLSAALKCADGGYVGHMIRPDRFDKFLAWADREGIDHGMTPEDWRLSRLDAPRKGNPVAETTLALAAKLSRDEFFAGALQADLICLPVLTFDDHEHIDQYQINEQFLTVDHPELGRELGFVRSPIDGMTEPVEISPAPTLGADQALLDDALTKGSTRSPNTSAAKPAGSPAPEMALAGLRVVDFGWVLAAPIGTRLLASFRGRGHPHRVDKETRLDALPDRTPMACPIRTSVVCSTSSTQGRSRSPSI